MKKRGLVLTMLGGIAAIGLLVFVTVAFIGPALAPKPQRVEEPLNPTATDYPGIRNQPTPMPSITPLSYAGAPEMQSVADLQKTPGMLVQQGQPYAQADPLYDQLVSAFHALRYDMTNPDSVQAMWDTVLSWAGYFRQIGCPMQEGSVWGYAKSVPSFANQPQVVEGLAWTIARLNEIGWDHKSECVIPDWIVTVSS